MTQTQPEASEPAPRRWYTSLRGKLTVAFLIIVLLFSSALVAADRGFNEMRASLDSIHETTLPRVLALQEVGLQVPDLLRTTDDAQRATGAEDLRVVESNLNLVYNDLLEVIALTGSEGLRAPLDQIEKDVEQILEAKRAAIEAATSSRLASSLFASEAADLAEQLEGDQIRVRADGDQATSIRDLRAQILTIVTELRVLPEVDLVGLERVERRYEIARRACIPMLASLEGDMRLERAGSFRDLFLAGASPDGLFAKQRAALEASDRVVAAVKAGAESGKVLQFQAAKFLNESAMEITRSRRSALAQARRARRIEIFFFVLALAVSGLILWFYVRGRIARRMEQLSDDLLRLSRGDLKVEVRGGGDHEMATLASAADVFRRNARELENTLEVLEMRNATLNEFAYVASHDLKSPMRGIANLAAWIQEDCEDSIPEASREHLALIAKRIEKMESLLEDLLRYSRLGNDEEVTEVLHLGSLIHDVVDLLDLPSSVQVTVEGADRQVATIAAPLQLCLRNLLQNAVRHSDQDRPEVRIGITDLEGREDRVQLVIEDNGPGIPEDKRHEAFRIFRKLNHGGAGTGMGLALTKRAVELMGGQITLGDADPRGARFVIQWPFGDPSRARRSQQSGRGSVAAKIRPTAE